MSFVLQTKLAKVARAHKPATQAELTRGLADLGAKQASTSLALAESAPSIPTSIHPFPALAEVASGMQSRFAATASWVWSGFKDTMHSLVPEWLRVLGTADVTTGAALGFGTSVAEVGSQFAGSFMAHPVAFAATGLVLGGTILGWNRNGLGERVQTKIAEHGSGLVHKTAQALVPKNLGMPVMGFFFVRSLVTGEYAHLVTGGTMIAGVQYYENQAERYAAEIDRLDLPPAELQARKQNAEAKKDAAQVFCVGDDVGPAFMTAEQMNFFTTAAQAGQYLMEQPSIALGLTVGAALTIAGLWEKWTRSITPGDFGNWHTAATSPQLTAWRWRSPMRVAARQFAPSSSKA